MCHFFFSKPTTSYCELALGWREGNNALLLECVQVDGLVKVAVIELHDAVTYEKVFCFFSIGAQQKNTNQLWTPCQRRSLGLARA